MAKKECSQVYRNSNMLRDVGYGESCCTTYIHSENVALPHIEFQKWSFFFLYYQQFPHKYSQNNFHFCLPLQQTISLLIISHLLSLFLLFSLTIFLHFTLGKYAKEHLIWIRNFYWTSSWFSVFWNVLYTALLQLQAFPIWILKHGEQNVQLNIHLPLVLYFLCCSRTEQLTWIMRPKKKWKRTRGQSKAAKWLYRG